MECRLCGAVIQQGVSECSACGTPVALRPPPIPKATMKGDETGGIIPYKNPPALIGYYLAVFSLVPCLGLPLGIAAIVCGVKGLRKYRDTPIIKGVAHAWIAIGLGSLTTLIWGGLIVASLVSAMLHK